MGLLLATSVAAAVVTRLPGCLSSKGDGSTVDCFDEDPLGIAADPNIIRALSAAGISRQRVTFYGCRDASFGTQIEIEGPPAGYAITYRLEPRMRRAELIAPIVHEIAHVHQLATSKKSIEELLLSPGSLRVELGADFLAGWMFSHAMQGMQREDFLHNLELVGHYTKVRYDHSWPEFRSAAFRFGFFHKEANTAAEAHDDFQRDLFAVLRKPTPPPPSNGASQDVLVPLSILSACADLSKLTSVLASRPRTCGVARGAMEAALVEKMRFGYGLEACFVEPPVNSLAGFRCFMVDNAASRDINCYRRSSPDTVRSYRQRYDTQYAEATKQYLGAATRCGLGKGEASFAFRSMMPTSLALVGRFELGFILPIGDAPPAAGSNANHGFARLDPSIEGNDVAFEYFNLWVPK